MKSRETFWRRLSGVVTVFMLVLSCSGITAVSAEESETVVSRHGIKKVVIVGDIGSLKAKLITDAINGGTLASQKGEPEITPNFNILCILGHSKAKTMIYVTDHLYYSTSPKCLETVYDVTYCTRSGCDYIDYTQIGISRIPCCK